MHAHECNLRTLTKQGGKIEGRQKSRSIFIAANHYHPDMIGDPEVAASSTCAQMDELATLEKCKLIVVEGNIGVGKSTLARGLAAQLQYKLFLEPTAENPFLGNFYSHTD